MSTHTNTAGPTEPTWADTLTDRVNFIVFLRTAADIPHAERAALLSRVGREAIPAAERVALVRRARNLPLAQRVAVLRSVHAPLGEVA